MISQPDKLFRDKLENFQHPAPAGAWDKIEGNLTKSNRKIVWLRVAAGIALISASAIVLWPAEKETRAISKTNEKNSVEKKDTTKQPEQIEQKSEQQSVVSSQQKNLIASAKKAEKAVDKNVQPAKDSVIAPAEDRPDLKELIAEVVPTKEKEEPSKTIVYTVADVNSKFLKKKLPAEATPESKDASGIQKLIGLAYAAKNSEAGLSDLRQKKDDLFALSFGKKKEGN